MGYSPIAFASMALVDIVAPGAATLVLARTSNREIEVRVTLPTEDADGDALSGLTELVIALLPETIPAENSFEGIAADQLATQADGNGGQSSTFFLAVGDAGSLKATRFSGLGVGTVYWVACVVKDDSV